MTLVIAGADDKTIALVSCRNCWAILLLLSWYFGGCKIGLGLREWRSFKVKYVYMLYAN